jgi:tRNA/rRNA methyltransferase
MKSPEFLARNLISLSKNNSVAVIFGPEDRGLTNADLKRCHQVVTIPTADFSSLNLAQAVMVMCYCLSTATRSTPAEFTPRLAKRVELDRMYDELTATLVEIGYMHPQNPDYWISRIRRFLTRVSLRAGEVGIIRGICRQIQWYGKRRYADGLKDGADGNT